MNLKLATAFEGIYRVDGVAADGKNYSGVAALTAHGLFAHLAGVIGGLERHGLAVVERDRLLIAWGPKDKVEIGAYRIDGDSMHGLWIPPAAAGIDLTACGQEHSERVDENHWQIEQAHDLEKKPYTGTITVEPVSSDQPQSVNILWRLHDGEYRSFGLRGDGWMVSTFNFAPETPHAIAAYEPVPDGWKGVQVWKDAQQVCRETLIASAPESASSRLSKRGAA